MTNKTQATSGRGVPARAVVGGSPGTGKGKTKPAVDLDQAVLAGGDDKEATPAIVQATAVVSQPEAVAGDAREPEVDPNLQGYLRRATPEEDEQLEEDLLAYGCREPMVVWHEQNKLVDGHRRLGFCKKHGLNYSIVRMSFADEAAVQEWMLRNQLGRRNSTPNETRLHRGELYNLRKRRQGERTDLKNGTNAQKLTTAEELAEEFGVNEKTIRKDGEFAAAVSRLCEKHGRELRDKILAGEVRAAKAVVAKLVEMPAVQQRRAVKQVLETGSIPKEAGEASTPSALTRLNAAWDKAGHRERKQFLRSKSADAEFVELVRGALPEEEDEEEQHEDQEVEETESESEQDADQPERDEEEGVEDEGQQEEDAGDQEETQVEPNEEEEDDDEQDDDDQEGDEFEEDEDDEEQQHDNQENQRLAEVQAEQARTARGEAEAAMAEMKRRRREFREKARVVAPRIDPNKPRHEQFFQFVCPFCAHGENIGLWNTYRTCAGCRRGSVIVHEPSTDEEADDE